jgi:hypothetical protein
MILLLGAFSQFGTPPPISAIQTVVSNVVDNPEPAASEPLWPAGLAPELVEIVKLAQAHLGDDVILEYIKNSGQRYAPSDQNLAYLSDLGVSSTVLGALVKQTPTPETIPPSPPLPPEVAATQAANANAFYKDLAPYGSWTQVPDYGLCWQPTVETIEADWSPYVDKGQWLYTDSGWFWQSQYSWGSVPFHYGRWAKRARLGWVWVPDQVWGPAWVAWRTTSSYSGWAPLPPGVGLDAALGLAFHQQPVGASFDFGVPPGWFTFVSQENFLRPNLASYSVSSRQTTLLFSQTKPVNNYLVAGHKVINLGIGSEKIATATHQPVKEIALNSDRTVPLEEEPPVVMTPAEDLPVPAPSPVAAALALPATPAPAIHSLWTGNHTLDTALKQKPARHFPRNDTFAQLPPGGIWQSHPSLPEPARMAAPQSANSSSSASKSK